MVRISKKDERTLQEKAEKRMYDYFKEEFYNFYLVKLGQNIEDVLFAYNKKVKDMNKYAFFNFNRRYQSLMVYLNPDLVDAKKSLVKLTAQRMALKIVLFKTGHKFDELSPEYLAATKHFKLWNYGLYPEVPQKWDVYGCSICNNNMAVFNKRLPINSELTSGKMKTPWHNKQLSSDSTEKPHQGNYAYVGKIELTNAELQKILYIMHKSVEFTNNFKDNTLKYIKNDNDSDWDF